MIQLKKMVCSFVVCSVMTACASRGTNPHASIGTNPECIKQVTGSTICKKEEHYMKDFSDGIDHSSEQRNKTLPENKPENPFEDMRDDVISGFFNATMKWIVRLFD